MQETQPILSGITIYPVKSIAGICLSSSYVELQGLAFDRRFVLVDEGNKFITARTEHKLLHISATLTVRGLQLSAPGMDPLAINYGLFTENQKQSLEIWGKQADGMHGSKEYDLWFSAYLGKPCALLYQGSSSSREIKISPEYKVSFADGFPLLLTSEESLADLNHHTEETISMSQFRPNLVVSGTTEAFAEDGWNRIRIGEVEFSVARPCTRCVLTTVNPKTLEKSSMNEPLKTLMTYRRDIEGRVDFGQNLIALNEGAINVGDTVEIISTKAKPVYVDLRAMVASTTVNVGNLSSEQTSQSDEKYQAAIGNDVVNQDAVDKGIVNKEAVNKRAPWPTAEQGQLKCLHRVQETWNTVTFWFQLLENWELSFKAGQYITLHHEINGESVSRCYTISSAPDQTNRFAITVERTGDGLFSNWLHEYCQSGTLIKSSRPEGLFHSDATESQKVLLLAAGSGITPMLSMIRYWYQQKSDKDIILIYTVKTEADLVSADELKVIAKHYPSLQLIFTLTQSDMSWPGFKGRISQSKVQQMVPDVNQRAVYICGGESFMADMHEACSALIVKEIYEEHFQLAIKEKPAVEHEQRSITLLFDSWDTFVEDGNSQDTLLEQSEMAGLDLDYSCRAGVCGICKVRVVSGSYDHVADYALTEDEKENGIALACSCIPQSDIVIESL
ncbi:hybrid-cluster NAD(P)-dependent oxidoreductase [Zooshikella harenae]|uniref:Hybrid-cluster NAD(P)-dependent oxidoreductase n=1 Tax=Zooshikella harenae TaxID=2827238 RepID=A0ABS5ZJC2_9GAMM|nr:hybrid-cluster NAD(P)-dependent oxidoreductase [Zooshikella harenae]MBU2713325.1 hybrid-cluster NAD(P)-dependent oxidoreductase [Zooshikella harenae]